MGALANALQGLLLLFPIEPQEPVVILTADRGGILAPCTVCPDTDALGGAARMGTLLATQRAALLVDAGNAFFGSADAIDGPGESVRDLYDLLGYDVVNVAYSDFRFGLETTLRLLEQTSFVPVSANLRDDAGELLFDPYAVRDIDGSRVAVIGVTLRPPGLDYLPHLKRQLAGIRVGDPLQALEENLPRARAEADRVIVLCYGGLELLAELDERFGGDVDTICVGDLRPHELPAGGTARLVASSAGGQHLTRFVLGRKGGVELVAVRPDLARDDDVDALLEGRLAGQFDTAAGEAFLAPTTTPDLDGPPTSADTAQREQVVAPSPTPSTLEDTVGDAPGAAEPAVVDDVGASGGSKGVLPPALGAVWREHATPGNVSIRSFSPGILAGVRNSASVGGLTLAVENLELTTALKGRECPPDKLHLELDVELELAPDALPLSVGRIEACLFGVLDRRSALKLRLPRREGDLATHFDLEPGGSLGGRIVLDLPRTGVRSLSLDFVPPGHAGLHVPLLEPDRPYAAPFDARENRAYRVEVLGFEATTELDGTKPARKSVFVSVDLRARNLLAGDGRPAGLRDWYRMPDRIQLVVDGIAPFELLTTRPGELTRALTLLPTERLGGRAVFAVPEASLADATSVELVCAFEPVELHGGGLVDLSPMRFSLVGERPDLTLPRSAHRIEDIDCTTLIGGFEQPERIAGRAPKRDFTWLTSEIWFVAPDERGVAIHPLQRCALVDAEGTVYPPDSHTWAASPSKNGTPFWIPPGGVRRLATVFQVPDSSVRGAGLLYRGLLRVETVAVDSGRGVAAPAADPERSATGQRVFDPTREPRGLSGPETEAVDRAIDRGREFLWEHLRQKIEERDLRLDANNIPAVLALLHCDGHELYPDFDRALRHWLAGLEPEKLGVYALGLVALVLDELDDPAFDGLFARTQTFLVESQGPNGTWGYIPEIPDRLVGDPLPVDTNPLDRIERTQSWYSNGDGDNSVSQFAILGLAAARRRGLVVDEEIWRRSLDTILDRQLPHPAPDKYGGWGYTRSTPYGSMTCAGICTTAIALRRLDPTIDPRDDLRIRDGLAWLDRHWTIDGNPEALEWHYYYLYGLERVGRILGTEFIGRHEWYPEGARYLIGAQNPDGSWIGTGRELDPRLTTSFALMFLQRATRSLEPPAEALAAGPARLETHAAEPVDGGNVYVILDASGSMLAEVDGRRKFDIARDAVRELVRHLPEGTRLALRVYGHRLRAIEEGASEDTELLVPFRELDATELAATLGALRPRGKTPLTLSLEEAWRDLRDAPAGESTLVLLLTDGGEDTRQDPVAAARPWAGDTSTELCVVGFDISRPHWTRQLHAIADAAGGRYIQVEAASDLAASVTGAAVSEPPAFTVEDEAGEAVARGRFGDSLELEPGAYTVSFQCAGKTIHRPVHLRAGRTVRVRLDDVDGR